MCTPKFKDKEKTQQQHHHTHTHLKSTESYNESVQTVTRPNNGKVQILTLHYNQKSLSSNKQIMVTWEYAFPQDAHRGNGQWRQFVILHNELLWGHNGI